MAAFTDVTIEVPDSGAGAVWDIKEVSGTATGATNGSTVSGALYKWKNGSWSNVSPMGPIKVTATHADETWSTGPDLTLVSPDISKNGPPEERKYITPGQYKVVVEIMDSMNFTTLSDTNTWTIP